MRVAVGTYFVVSNSFSHRPIDLGRMQRATRRGDRALAPHRARRGQIGAIIDLLETNGIEIVALPSIAPGLSGAVTVEAQAWAEAEFSAALAALPKLDGVFLQLHGGGATEDGLDCDGRLCAVIREHIGEHAPIMTVVDGHANISSLWHEAATAIVGVKTNPHYDFYERGTQVARMMVGALEGKVSVASALVQPPLLPALQQQRIAPGWPLDDLVRQGLNYLRADSRVLDVTVIGGWPYADCAHAGLSVMATTNGEQALANDIAGALGEAAWERRFDFRPRTVSVEDAIREAMETDEWPVVIGDIADSGGAATTGDGTAVLRALLELGATGAVVGHLTDREAVQVAAQAGVGSTVALEVGGKLDGRHGPPVAIEGRVRALVDGDFRTSTRFNAGRQRRGLTAVVDCGGVEVILTSRDAHSFEPNTFRSVGIEPSERRILVAKSEMQHRAGLESVGKTFIDVDAPGISTPYLERLPFKYLRRPIFPLDVGMTFAVPADRAGLS